MHTNEGSQVMAANTILPVLLLTALKDQFLVCLDVARCSTAKDKKHPPPSTYSDPWHSPLPTCVCACMHTRVRVHAHTGADKDQCLLQNIYFQLEDLEDVKILVKLLPLLQIQRYSIVDHNIKQTKSLLQT
jgi:hypothetical protein